MQIDTNPIASGGQPDILFLDIQMPGMDGMETAKPKHQDNENMILIFVTAAEEYVFQAFDVGAFHYLVKPFSDEKFKEVVTKAVHNIKEGVPDLKKTKNISWYRPPEVIKKFFCVILCMPRCITGKLLSIHEVREPEYYGKLQELSDMAGTDFSEHTEPILYILNM